MPMVSSGLNMDMDVAATVQGVAVVVTVGCSGVSYISGDLCGQLGIDRSVLKGSTAYTTLFPGETLRRMSIVPELTVTFASGKVVTHGPWVVDDAAPVPMQTGNDFITSAGGLTVHPGAGQGLSWGHGAKEVVVDYGSDRLLAMFAPQPRADEACMVCEKKLKGIKLCSGCAKAGESVCPSKVLYCSAACQRKDWVSPRPRRPRPRRSYPHAFTYKPRPLRSSASRALLPV